MDICTVTGTIDKKDGTTPQVSAPVRVLKLIKDDELISTAELVTRTDADGAFSFTVPRLSTAYVYSGYIEGFDRPGGVPVAIPDADTVELKTLLPARNPPSNAVSQATFNTHTTLIASSADLGHVRIGSGISIALDGTISVPAVSQEIVEDYLASFFNSTTPALHAVYDDTGNTVDLSIDNASPTIAGLMSATDKAYVDGLPGVLSALQPLNSNLTTIAGLSPANDDLLQRKAGAWTNRTPAQVKADLALVKSDVGLGNVLNVAQEPAIAAGLTTQYWRGDKTFATLDTSVVPENGNLYFTNSRADGRIAAAVGVSVQGYDSDLTAVAGLSTTGLIARTATGAASTRTLTAGSSKLSVTNGDGVSGNPTIDLGTLTASDIPTLTSAKLSDFNSAASAAAPVQSVNGSTGAVSLTLPANTTATASQFFTAYNSMTGAFTKAQPAFTDLSGTATVAQIPTLTSAKISDFSSAASAAAPVQSVNSQMGAVTLTTTNVAEGTNLYFTNARADARITLAAITSALGFTPANKAGDTFTGVVIEQGASGSAPGLEVGLAGDTTRRVAIGLNSTDVARVSFGPGNAARDLFLERAGGANLRHGAPDAASPVAQIESVQNVVAGTLNTPGVDWTFQGSQGTGTGAGGRIIFKVAPAGTTGTSQNALASVLTLNADLSATFANTVTATTFVGALTGTASGNLTSASGLNASNLTSGTVPSARLALVASDIPTLTLSKISDAGTIASQAEANYALLAGRSGGQTLTGGTAASDNLTLQSTSNSTKGYLLLGTGGLVGVNKSTPGAQLHVVAKDASTKGVIVQGAASQSADLQEWQDSTGAVLASINQAGSFQGSNLLIFNSPVGMTSTRVGLAAGTLITFTTSANIFGTSNASISQSAASILQIGDGGANANGTLKAARFQFSTTVTPTSSADSQGNTGDMRVDGNYFYYKDATRGWVRAALSTF